MYENSIVKDIENVQTIYITGHTNPDGDCIGSTFAFAQIMAKLGKTPVILLDDVMGELDESRQALVFDIVKNMQVFITACNENAVRGLSNGAVFRVENGNVREE